MFTLFLLLFGLVQAAPAQIFGPGLQFTSTNPAGATCVSTSVVVYMPSGALFTCQNGILTAVSGGGGSGTIAVTPNVLAGDNAGNAVSSGIAPANVAQINQANSFGSGFKQTVQASGTTAGFNFGGVTADPSAKASGDLWFRTDLTVPGVRYYDGSAVRSVMVGPGAATDSNLVCWNGTGGLLTKDCGIASSGVVRVTGTPTATHLATWANSNTIQDAGSAVSIGALTDTYSSSSTAYQSIQLSVVNGGGYKSGGPPGGGSCLQNLIYGSVSIWCLDPDAQLYTRSPTLGQMGIFYWNGATNYALFSGNSTGSKIPGMLLLQNAVTSTGSAPTLTVTSCSGATLGSNSTDLVGTITALPTGTCTIKITWVTSGSTTAQAAHAVHCLVSNTVTPVNQFVEVPGSATTNSCTITGT